MAVYQLPSDRERELLAKSSGWTSGQYIGYLPFSAANDLVGGFGYRWQQISPWGYIVERPR